MLLSWFEIYEANLRKIARHFIQLRNNHFGPPLFAFSVAADVMKGKKKKISMQCIVTIGSSFLIYYPFFFCTCLFTKHFVLLQKQQEPKQVSFLSAICHWLFVKSLANCFYLSSRCSFKVYFCCPKVHIAIQC